MKDKAVPETEEAGSGVEIETQAAEEEEIDPAVQKIEAMAAAMREAEAHR
jgi:adenylate cyclase class IV